MQVDEFLEQSARQFPEKTALICGEQRLSYRRIEEQCNRLARGLITIGVQRGDCVAVYLDSSVEAVLSIFAILKADAVITIVNPATKAEKLTHILSNSGAKVLITEIKKLATIQSCWGDLPDLATLLLAGKRTEKVANGVKRVVGWDDLMAEHVENVEAPPKRNIDIDIAALIYTSGSTGNSKGVVMTHANMVSAATSVVGYLENTSDDIILNVLPLSSSYGLYQVLTAFKVGATVVLEQSFTYPHAVIQRLIDERITGLAIVPTVAAVLLQLNLAEYQFPSLRYVTNAGAALPTQHVMRLRKSLPPSRG